MTRDRSRHGGNNASHGHVCSRCHLPKVREGTKRHVLGWTDDNHLRCRLKSDIAQYAETRRGVDDSNVAKFVKTRQNFIESLLPALLAW